jgi:hypothetical protein
MVGIVGTLKHRRGDTDMIDNLCEVTEERRVAAHKAGCAYFRNNRVDLSRDQAASVARSIGWHGELAECWFAGFLGERRRSCNREVEAMQLKIWTGKPEREVVYIVQRADGLFAETWLGTVMCKSVVRIKNKWKMFTRRGEPYTMCSIEFLGTNGARYTGRYGSDWTQACRVRRATT